MKTAALFLALCTPVLAGAQFVVSSGQMTVQAGATFTIDSLVLQPTAPLVLGSNELQRVSTVVNGYGGAQSVNRVYQFTNPVAFTGTAGFYYADGELGINTESGLKVAYLSGNTWVNAPGSAVNTATNYVSTTFSNATISQMTATSSATPLPVSLQSFDAYAANSGTQALISWQVGTESNIDAYFVERSTDGKAFRTLGTVKASGSRDYGFTDHAPASGINYYRLRIQDNASGVAYSQMRSLVFDGKMNMPVTVGPNPATGVLTITLADAGLIGKDAVLYNLSGREVYRASLRSAQSAVSVAGLAAGTYLMKIGEHSFKIDKR